MPSSMQDASSSSVRASTETDGAPFVVTYIDGNRVEGTASSSAEPRPDVTVPTIFEKSARVKAMRHVHVRKPDVSDPVVLGIASRFGTLGAMKTHPANVDSTDPVDSSHAGVTDDAATVASLLSNSPHLPKPPNKRSYTHTQPSPRLAATMPPPRGKRGPDDENAESAENAAERLPSLMSVSAGLQLIRSSEKMVASQISGRFQLQLKGMPQVSWRGIMNDDPNSGIQNIPEAGGVMSTPQDHVFRNDARIHDTQIAGVEPWLNEVLKQKSAAPLLYDLSVMMSKDLPINHPEEQTANTVAFAARTELQTVQVLPVVPESLGGAGDAAVEQGTMAIGDKEEPSDSPSDLKGADAEKPRSGKQVTFTQGEGDNAVHLAHEICPLQRCGLDRGTMSLMGLQPAIVDRVYRSLFVYSVGFHNIIAEIHDHAHTSSEEAVEAVEKLTSSLWLLFMHLLEHTDESHHSLMLSRIQKLYHGKLKRYADEIGMVLHATKDDSQELGKMRTEQKESEELLLMTREDATSRLERVIHRFQAQLLDRKGEMHSLHDVLTATKHELDGVRQSKADMEANLLKQIEQLDNQKSKLGQKCRRLELETGRSQQFREDALRKLDQYQTAKEWADDSLLDGKKKLSTALAMNSKLAKQLAEETMKGNRLAELLDATEAAKRDAEDKARQTRSAEQTLERKVDSLQGDLFRERKKALQVADEVTGESSAEITEDARIKGLGYGAGVDKYGNPIIAQEMLSAARDKIRSVATTLSGELATLQKEHEQCILDRDSNAALAVVWQNVATEARASEEKTQHDLSAKIADLEDQLEKEKEGRKQDNEDLGNKLFLEEQKFGQKNAEAERLHAQLQELTADIRRLVKEQANHQKDMDLVNKQLQEREQELKALDIELSDEKATTKELEKTLQSAREDAARSDAEIMNLKAEDRRHKQKLIELDVLIKVTKAKHEAEVAQVVEERDDAINMLKEISQHNSKNRSVPDSRAGSRPSSRAGSRPTSKGGPRPCTPSVVQTPKGPSRPGTAELRAEAAKKEEAKTKVKAAEAQASARPNVDYSHRDVDLGFLARAQDLSVREGWDTSRPIILPPYDHNEPGALPPFNLDSKSDAYHRSTDAFEDQLNIDRAKTDKSSGAAHRVSHLETKALVHKLHREMEGAELALHDYCIGYDLMSIRYENTLEELDAKQATIESLEAKIVENKQKAKHQITTLKSKLAIAKSLNQKVLDNAKSMHQKDVRNEYDLQKEVAKLKRDLKSRTHELALTKERLSMVQDDYTGKLEDRAQTMRAAAEEREALRQTLADEAAKNLSMTSRLAASVAEISHLEEKVQYLRGEVKDRDRMVDHLRDHIKQQELKFEDLHVLVREQSHVTDASTQYPHTVLASRAMQSDLSWVKGVLHAYTRGESSSDFFPFESHKADYMQMESSEGQSAAASGPELPDGSGPEDDEAAKLLGSVLPGTSASSQQQTIEDPRDFKIKYRVAADKDKSNASQNSNDVSIPSRFLNDAGSQADESMDSEGFSIPFRVKRGSFSTKGTTVTDNQSTH